jgi:hypothetical protein
MSAYRFSMRRLELALLRRDSLMRDDPIRIQSLSLAAGCMLAAVLVAVCAVLTVVGSR